jgi:hypothetical protein
MFAEHEYERWDEWEEEQLDDELIDEILFDELDLEEVTDEFGEDLDDEYEEELLSDENPLVSGRLRQRTEWLQTRVDIEAEISSDELLDFHFFIEGTRGVCKGERNFFKRMKLYFYDQ